MSWLFTVHASDIDMSHRRGILRTLAGAGIGALIGMGGSPERLHARHKKKRHGSKKKRCKKRCHESCPDSCGLVATRADGGKMCSIRSAVPEFCTPCTSSTQCLNLSDVFSICATEIQILDTGQRFTLGCQGSPPGECRAFVPCVI